MPRRERSSTSSRAVSSGQPRPMDGCVFSREAPSEGPTCYRICRRWRRKELLVRC